jgi:hypothetical protein
VSHENLRWLDFILYVGGGASIAVVVLGIIGAWLT